MQAVVDIVKTVVLFKNAQSLLLVFLITSTACFPVHNFKWVVKIIHLYTNNDNFISSSFDIYPAELSVGIEIFVNSCNVTLVSTVNEWMKGSR